MIPEKFAVPPWAAAEKDRSRKMIFFDVLAGRFGRGAAIHV